MPGNLPTGCIPIILTLYASPNKSDYDKYGCLDKFNGLARYHNRLLRREVRALQKKYKLTTTKIAFADYFRPIVKFLQKPAKFGEINIIAMLLCTISIDRSVQPRSMIFTTDMHMHVHGAGFNGGTALVACCGAGGRYNYNATAACGLPGATACADVSRALNWDGIHLTDKAYGNIAAAWLRGPYAEPTILDLAH